MKKYKYLILLIIICLIPNCVYAQSDVNFSCFTEVIPGNKVTCYIKTNSTEKILGITAKYKYDNALTYEQTILDNSLLNLTSNSEGITAINVEGIENNKNIATINFIVSNKVKTNNNYVIELNDIQLSNGTQDILITKKQSTIKILSVNDIVNHITINNEKLDIKDGVTNYTVTVPNNITKVDILSELKSTKFKFVENMGPRTINNLLIGDNIINLSIENEEQVLINYKININRQTEKETLENNTNNKIDNPKTSCNKIIIISFILIISIVSLFFVIRKRMVK